MDHVYQSGATGTPPALPSSPSSGYPQAGSTPTVPGPFWYHMITEEIRAVLVAAGVTPAAATLTQLRDAIRLLAAGAAVDGAGSYPAGSVGARLLALNAALAAATLKAGQHHTAQDDGGDATGATVATNALNDSFAETHVVYGVPDSLFTFADVTLSHNQTYRGEDTRVTAAAGTNLFKLNGTNAAIRDLYVADATALSGAVIRVDQGRGQVIDGVNCPNVGAGFIDLQPASGSAAITRITNVIGEGITGFGLRIRSSVNDGQGDIKYLAGKIDYVLGLGKPRSGSIGWDQSTPVVGGLAVGGHQKGKVTLIGLNTGARISYGQYLRYSDWIIDSCSGYALEVDNGSTDVEFGKLFVGTSGGIKVSGASVVAIDQLTTRNNGTVPPWGQAGFYDNTGQIYDVTVLDTSELTVRGWRGDKRVSVASTAKLNVEGGQWERCRSRSIVAANVSGTPVSYFLGPNGVEANEADATVRIHQDGWLFVVVPFSTGAPGAGESFTYTVRVSGADKTAAVISGAASFGAGSRSYAFNVPVLAGSDACVKLTLSGGAGASRHDCAVQFLPK
jgi:hypothetical protein